MAFVVPLVAAFSTGAVAAAGGLAAFATGTLGGFLTVAGAVLGGVGAITGSKDLSKLGGLMALGGGLATAFGSAASATEAGATAGLDGASEGLTAADAAREAATFAEKAAANAGTLGESVASLAPQTLDLAQVADASQLSSFAADPGVGNAADSLYSRALTMPGGGSQPLGMPTPEGALGGGGVMSVDVQHALQPYANNLTAKDVTSFWDRAKKIGQFVKNNKELVQIGGQMLGSMYGPEAEALDWQKSIYARRHKNLNSPVLLKYGS